LAGLLLPALASAKAKARQTQCINNLKQLGLGMMMYLNDSNDAFPNMASAAQGWQPDDWIFWRQNDSANPKDLLQNSMIVSELTTGSTTNLFRCPADINNKWRISQGSAAYWYSYSLNGLGVISSVDHGMGSSLGEASFKAGSILNPGDKILLAEEPATPWGQGGSDAPPAGVPVQANGTTYTLPVTSLDDGRWEAFHSGNPNNTLTVRHRGKADLNFGDGHVETQLFTYALDPAHVDALK
ncbi:MAG TPA: DUF1559 domain-containing protein, partial [Verrucomicrobiae bacterium]|nr:DUF1559 domain-containing protein [Verrucomicrobiae bacterium]